MNDPRYPSELLPSNWNSKRAKYLFKNRSEKGYPNEQLLSASQKYGVVPQDFLEQELSRQVMTATKGFENFKLVKEGDFVISLRSFEGGIEYSAHRGIISGAYIIMIPKKNLDHLYYRYYLKNFEFISRIQAITTGIREGKTIRYEDFCSLELPIPLKSDQKSIASFLDRETARIDALIDKKEQQIVLLKEKRAALISHAVTRGLDPNVKMKDSGVEWLGEIPEHWVKKLFKFAIKFQEGPGIMADDFYEEGVPLLRIGNLTSTFVTLNGCNYLDENKVNSKWNHFKLNEGDLLISCSATTGIVSEVGKESIGSVPYTGIIRLQPKGEHTIKSFIKYLVVSSTYIYQIELFKAGTAIQHYGPTHLRQIVSVFPPPQEQVIISSFLDHETARIDALIEKIQQSIKHLIEYRTALISAAVTGKIDVREE